MTVKLLTEHHLEFLSLKRGCTSSSESTLVKLPHCWKSHVAVQVASILKFMTRANASWRLTRVTVLCIRASRFIRCLVLIQSRMAGNHRNMTEKLVTGTQSINTNKQISRLIDIFTNLIDNFSNLIDIFSNLIDIFYSLLHTFTNLIDIFSNLIKLISSAI